MVIFASTRHRRQHRSPACRATRSASRRPPATRSGWGCMALAAGALAFALAPFVGRGAAVGHRRCGHVRRLHPQRLSGGDPRARAVRQPDLVRLDDEPPPARRPVRLGVAGARRRRRDRPARRSASRRSSAATSARRAPSRPRACRGPSSGLARPGRPAVGERPADVARVGHRARASSGWSSPAPGSSFIDQLRQSPEFMRPARARSSRASTSASVGGFLQLLFVEFGLILAGLAAATLVASWASDETSGRLEILLATPLAARPLGRSPGAIGVFVGDRA